MRTSRILSLYNQQNCCSQEKNVFIFSFHSECNARLWIFLDFYAVYSLHLLLTISLNKVTSSLILLRGRVSK
jgi:hypothetical protein